MSKSSCANLRVDLLSVLRGRPQAAAKIAGGEGCPDISGSVCFYQTRAGVIVRAELWGLPCSEGPCGARVFGFHIHEGGACAGNDSDPLADAMGHYNPCGCEHLQHAGDLPPLFGNRGYALSVFLTDRFSVRDIIGRAVIIHDSPDDFTTQPSGNSGMKIACGVVRRK